MTDPIRNLLISLSSHMAYMQGQLEAGRVLDDPEDYYWYRESVRLRQKVADALADEPAVPDGREPASVTGQPRPVPVSERLQQMEDLAADAVAGLRYIEQCHGRLYGVGWDRVYKKADRLKPAHDLPIPQQQETING